MFFHVLHSPLGQAVLIFCSKLDLNLCKVAPGCVLPWRISCSRLVSGLLEALLKQYYYSKSPFMFYFYATPEEPSVVTPHRGLLPVCCLLTCVSSTALRSSAASSGTGEEQAGDVGISKMCSAQGSCTVSSPSAFHSKESFVSELLSVPGIVPCGCSVQGLSASITAAPCQLTS